MNFSSESGSLGQVAQWIEYPFVAKGFPLALLLGALAALLLLAFFLHDGVNVISETVGEIVPT